MHSVMVMMMIMMMMMMTMMSTTTTTMMMMMMKRLMRMAMMIMMIMKPVANKCPHTNMPIIFLHVLNTLQPLADNLKSIDLMST